MIREPKSSVAAAIAILGDKASTETPSDPPPNEYIRVSRIGGMMVNPVTDKARLLIECYAPTGSEAELLANSARYMLCNSFGQTFAGVRVRWCKEVSGPVAFPDEVGPRYQFIVELSAATK